MNDPSVWLIWSDRKLGGHGMWWRYNYGHSYTHDLHYAGRFTRRQADIFVRPGGKSVVIHESEAEAFLLSRKGEVV